MAGDKRTDLNEASRKVLLTALAMTLAPAAAAHAQAAAQPTTAATTQLEEVVVTAEKRSELLQNTPISMSAVGQSQIQGLGAKTLGDVARTIPGLQLVNTGFSEVPTIRGIYSPVGAATVGYYVDDTPVQIQPDFTNNAALELFDLDRVEVLRGPQGTLYGASAMGGTIRFITPEPSLTRTSGRFHAEVSGTDGGGPNYQLGGAVGAPIIEDKLGFRGSISYREDGGYIDHVSRTTGEVDAHDINDAHSLQLRGALRWQVSPALTVTPSFLFQDQHNDDLPTFLSGLKPFQQNFATPQPGSDRFYLPSLSVSLALGSVTFTSITSYFSRDAKQVVDYSTLVPELLTGEPIVPGFENYISAAHHDNIQRNFTQEFRLASSDSGRLTWIAGAFIARDKQDLDFPLYEPQFSDLVQSLFGVGPLAAFGEDPLPGSIDFFTNTATVQKQLAGFGEVSYQLIDGLKITGGLRVSRSELDYDRVADGPLNGGFSAADGKAVAHPVTPKFSISYQADPNTLFYASASKGFRVGGVNNPIPQAQCAADLALATGGLQPNTTYDPDTLWDYEVGVKSQMLANRLRVNASVFRIDWSNMQQGVSLPDCGFGYVTNFGSARSQGFELEGAATPLPGLQLTAALDYTHARLSSDVLGAPSTTGAQAVFGLSGDRIPGIPDWTVSLGAEYRFPINSRFDGYVRGDYQYVGSSTRSPPPGEIGYDPAIYQARDYSYVSARAGVEWGQWSVALFVNNLTNSRPIIGALTQLQPVTDTPRETTLQPRVIGVSLDRRF